MLFHHPISPIYNYFRVEYKNHEDAIAAYEQFLIAEEKVRKENFKRLLSKFWSKLCEIFTIKDENIRYEQYLAQSTSLEDLERRQRIWDNYLSHKRHGAFI